MQQGEILILVVIGLVILSVVLIWLSIRKRRSNALRAQFGDEYDRTIEVTGHRAKAEANLRDRAQRVAKLDIRPLNPAERTEFDVEWQQVKAVFVDSPPEAVLRADRLLTRMLQVRGFPTADFEHRHEDLTVDHAEVAREYRAGREITERQMAGQASTEDMRRAIKHYEALFTDMMNDISDTVKHRPVTMQAQQG